MAKVPSVLTVAAVAVEAAADSGPSTAAAEVGLAGRLTHAAVAAAAHAGM